MEQLLLAPVRRSRRCCCRRDGGGGGSSGSCRHAAATAAAVAAAAAAAAAAVEQPELMRRVRRAAAAARPLSLLMLALLTAACGAVPTGETVGWGELQEDWRGEVERLSWSPRAYRVHGFLTAAECDHIINLAKPKLEVSLVVDNESGAFKASEVRTSTGAAFGRSYDQVLTRIERRIAAVTMMPLEHQEGLQVLRYVDGQKYEPHMDSFWDPKNQAREHGGQRVVTFLMYLSTPEEGGETVFPKGTPKAQGLGWSECARQGFAVKAKRGDALMFYSLKPDGALDPASEHGSCPTLKGEKYSATKWLHVWPFGVDKQPGPCEDQNEMCAEWAYFGECEKNPAYMLVACKHSCRVPCDA